MIAGPELTLEAAAVSANAVYSVRLIGLGATQTVIDPIREGSWFGTYVELPWEEGYICGQSMIEAVRGVAYDNIVDLEGSSPVSAAVATKKNLDKFPDWNPKWAAESPPPLREGRPNRK
jgi:ribose transport system substrate-binding protein